jgi:hypothetical protein
MRSRKGLEARLARLEASFKGLPDLAKEEQEKKSLLELHIQTWLAGGSFEDIPEKERDPELWEFCCEYGPSWLGLVCNEHLPGRDQLLAAGVDFFTRAEGIDKDLVGGCPYSAGDPNVPPKS